MAVRIITKPSVEPVTVTEAKAHCRVDHSLDDLMLATMIQGAREFCEKFTARAFVTQTLELVIDEFPVGEILIPRPPLQSVVSITYDDSSGMATVLDPSGYEVDTASAPGWVVPSSSGWPSTWDGINAVRIRYIAGYDPTTDSPPDPVGNVPATLKNAILLHVGSLYAQRESVVIGTIASIVPTGGILHMLRQHRVALGFA